MNSKFESIRHRKRNRNIYFWDHYRGHCDLNETVWINLSTTQPAGKHFKPSESSRVKQIKNNLMISAYAHLSISVLNCEIEIKTSRMAIIGDNQEIQFFFQSVVWQSTAEGACLDFYIWCWILKPSNACCYAFDAFSWRSPSMETGASSEFNNWLNLNGVNCFRNKETLENVENHYLVSITETHAITLLDTVEYKHFCNEGCFEWLPLINKLIVSKLYTFTIEFTQILN